MKVIILLWELKHKVTKSFVRNYFVEKSSVESGDDDTLVIKVRNSGEPFLLR